MGIGYAMSTVRLNSSTLLHTSHESNQQLVIPNYNHKKIITINLLSDDGHSKEFKSKNATLAAENISDNIFNCKQRCQLQMSKPEFYVCSCGSG